MVHVRHDADNRDLVVIDRQRMPERIDMWPTALRHRLADDRHKRTLFAVVLGEDASTNDANAERMKIIRRRGPVVCADAWSRLHSVYQQPARAVAAGKRQTTRRAGNLDARNLAQ